MNIFSVLSLTDLARRKIKRFITWTCLPTALTINTRLLKHHSSLCCVRAVLKRECCHISMQGHARKVNKTVMQKNEWQLNDCSDWCLWKPRMSTAFTPSHPFPQPGLCCACTVKLSSLAILLALSLRLSVSFFSLLAHVMAQSYVTLEASDLS